MNVPDDFLGFTTAAKALLSWAGNHEIIAGFLTVGLAIGTGFIIGEGIHRIGQTTWWNNITNHWKNLSDSPQRNPHKNGTNEGSSKKGYEP